MSPRTGTFYFYSSFCLRHAIILYTILRQVTYNLLRIFFPTIAVIRFSRFLGPKFFIRLRPAFTGRKCPESMETCTL